MSSLETSEITNLRIERLYPKDDDHSPEVMESKQRVDVESTTTILKPVSQTSSMTNHKTKTKKLPIQSTGDNSEVARTFSLLKVTRHSSSDITGTLAKLGSEHKQLYVRDIIRPSSQQEDIDTLSLESGDLDGWDQDRPMASSPRSVELSKDAIADTYGDGSREYKKAQSPPPSIEAAGKERNKPHMCQWCGKCFKFKGKFNIHIRKHTGEKPYACDVCEKCFSQKSTLDSHRRTHTGEKPHKCPTCDKGFSRKSHLRAHSRCHTGETPYVCQLCGKSFNQKAYLTVHNRIHTGDVRGVGVCERSEMANFIGNHTEHTEEYVTSAQSGMTHSSSDCIGVEVKDSNEHMSSVSLENAASHFINIKTEEGDACLGSSKFPRQTEKASNETEIHNAEGNQVDGSQHDGQSPPSAQTAGGPAGNERNVNTGRAVKRKEKVQCPVCFKYVSYLPGHMVIHGNEQKYICEICGKIFKHKRSMTGHMMCHIDIHAGTTGQKQHVCQWCGKYFKCQYYLTMHTRTHTGEKPFTCEFCETSFSQKSSLNAHRRTHTDERPHKCPACDKGFRRKSHLIIHSRVHSGETPYECKWCGKGFTQKTYMNIHTRTHTGEKPFTCEICEKKFSQKSSLTSHRRTHTDEKPHKCPTCDKEFRCKLHLTIHIRAHTGEIPYECQWCGKGFTRKTSLTIHIRSHIGEKPYLCQWCGKSFAAQSNLTDHTQIHTGSTL